MRKKTKLLATLLAICLLVGLLGISASAAVDATPVANVSINYTVGYDVTWGTLTPNQTYFAVAGNAVPTLAELTTTRPATTVTYWEIALDSNGTAVTSVALRIADGTLIALSGNVTFVSEANSVGALHYNGAKYATVYVQNPVYYANNTNNNGKIAIVVRGINGAADTYYTATANDWAPAVAKCGDYYYENLAVADTAVVDTALRAANAANADIVLLQPAVIDFTDTVNAAVEIVCCNGSTLTVTGAGNLTLKGKVYNNQGSLYGKAPVEHWFNVTNGGTIDDQGGNTIYAFYTQYNTAASGNSTVLGTNTTLLYEGGSVNALVSVRGHFALLGGYFHLLSDLSNRTTTIDNTYANAATGTTDTAYAAGDVVIVSRAATSEMRVNDGRVHDLCPFDANHIYLSDGSLFIKLGDKSKSSSVTGAYNKAGDLYVLSGSSTVYGELDNLNVYGSDGAVSGGYVTLYGTANKARIEGVCDLSAAASSPNYGAVTTEVVGVAYNGHYGTLSVSNLVQTDIPVKGRFAAISGAVYMVDDLTIEDATNTKSVKCANDTYVLEVLGAPNDVDGHLYYNDFKLLGTFGSVKIHNVDIELQGSVKVAHVLDADNADIAVSGSIIGATTETATSSLNNGTLTFDNSQVFLQITGAAGSASNQVHVRDNCYPTATASCIGLKGTFDAVTGRVFTCGDLIIHSTNTSGLVGFSNLDEISGKAVLTGGMTYFSDDGMTWNLTLDDSKGSSYVELASGTTSGDAVWDPGFSAITVDDTHDTAALVSLTMNAATVNVTIGAPDTDKHENIGLKVDGDALTVVTLGTHEIYGYQYGVRVTGQDDSHVTVSLTGSDADTLKTISTGSNINECRDGLTLDYGTLNLTNYAVTGENNGISINNNSTALLENVEITDAKDDDIGLAIAGESDVTLKAAEINGAKGVELAGISALHLQDSVIVTGKNYGVHVIDGSVDNAEDPTIGTGTRLFQTTANNSYAMFVNKGSVVLDGYTFDATVPGGSGLVTASEDVITVDLSYSPANKDNAYLWGYQNGVTVGKQTVMTLSDYKVFGCDNASVAAISPDNSGVGASVSGVLRLKGVMEIIGGGTGLFAKGGIVTNYQNELGEWTTDEQAGSPLGEGTIKSGPGASTIALRMEKNGINGSIVTLGSYALVSSGGSGESYGLYADGGRAWLIGGNINKSIEGTTGGGAYLKGGAEVILEDLLLRTTSDHAARVVDGKLNLGKGVTLGAGSGTADIYGESSANAHLFSFLANTGIKAQGGFHYLTGYAETTGDLTVIGTLNTGSYVWKNGDTYENNATIKGGALTHDLHLGTEAITAILDNGSQFASVEVEGTALQQQDITVAGSLTTLNSDMAYGFTAIYSDIKFSPAAEGSPKFVRSFTANQASAATLSFGSGARVYLTDQVNVFGAGTGLKLTNDALVTNLKNGEDWVVTYAGAAEGVAQSDGTVNVSGQAADLSGDALLLLNDHSFIGGTGALKASGNTEVWLAGPAQSASDDLLKLTAQNSGHAIEISTAKNVTIRNYKASLGLGTDDLAVITNGTTTIEGGMMTALTNASALRIDGPADVTLKGVAVYAAKADVDCIDVNGTVAQRAVLRLTENTVVTAAVCRNGLNVGANADVYVSDSTITTFNNNNTPDILTDDTTGTAVTNAGNLWFSGDEFIGAVVNSGDVYMSGGSVTGDTANTGRFSLTGGTLDGNVTGSGALWIHAGSVTGTVTGETTAALYIAPELSTDVNINDTFATVTGKATQAAGAPLTIAATIDAVDPLNEDKFVNAGEEGTDSLILTGTDTPELVTLQSGTYTVNGPSGEGMNLTIAEPADVTLKGNFRTLNGDAVLDGTARIGGGVSELLNTVGEEIYHTLTVTGGETTLTDGLYENLTVSGGKTILAGGSYKALTVDGGEAALTKSFSIPTVTVARGTLLMTGGSLQTRSLVAGTTDVATFRLTNVTSLAGTLTVNNDNKLTNFPTATGSGTYKGWYVKDAEDTIYTGNYVSGYLIPTDGVELLPKFEIPPMVGPAPETYEVNSEIANSDTEVELGNWGNLTLDAKRAEAGAEVILKPTVKTSFYVSKISVTDSEGREIVVTDRGDGTWSFLMPASDVKTDVEFAPVLGTPQNTPAVEYAVASSHKIYLNGTKVDIQAYNVNGNNYFKLRDIAQLLTETTNRFSVGFNDQNLVTAVTGEAYSPVGGELSLDQDLSDTCVVSRWNLDVNGILRYLKCYNIGGNNFFQLRELGRLFGFMVDFDTTTNSVLITTR